MNQVNNSITYPAIFTKEEGGYSIDIPDIDGAFTCADTLEEGIGNCQEVIGAMLYDKEDYPKMSVIDGDKLEDNQLVIYINVYLPYQFSKVKEVYKNKMLTVPVWLEMLAKNKNINFSRVLQEGLKKELNIK
ncbi:type II toxin-antitoxin system HicB family antitoxin [Anaerococcus sp. AGMB09787]|uniref:type II toxin-antitoxin system HicB family antitoxin n=1 Tax=Anaerococcus sp. AGMB09787 TaxID=2922869 RepID=UPI001FAEC60F|nr:type II toxin-antitoxin system HicB family antitoxin [Anaerococcus sp. AGMB09787]